MSTAELDEKKGNFFLLLFVLKGNNRRRGHTSASVKPLGWQLNVLEHYYINKFPKKYTGLFVQKAAKMREKKESTRRRRRLFETV
jgi:hypothetical protein